MRNPVFAHSADAARLLVGVDTDRGWISSRSTTSPTGTATTPVCGEVFERRLGELTAIPGDGALFGACAVATPWSRAPLTYLVHIDDLLAAETNGWTATLTGRTELCR